MAPRSRTSALIALLLLALALPCFARAAAGEGSPTAPAADTLAAADTSATRERVAAAGEEEFPVVLGSFTTTLLGSRPERTANIALAAEALDGAVVAPGEVLSFNVVVGPRTIARGYQAAPVILHETRQLQTGGGVCQVASTLFTAGLLAGLTPVERWRHSSPVDYIALGEDATIAWGAKDLRLRNDLAQRVRVRARVLGATMSVRVEGENAEPVRYELETVEQELPADPGVEGGRPGREIDLYRVRRGGAGESRESVHRDVYPPSQGRRSEP